MSDFKTLLLNYPDVKKGKHNGGSDMDVDRPLGH